MSFHLAVPIDFARHNEEVGRVWDAYRQRKPCRVPMTVGGSITNLLQNPVLNSPGFDFHAFFTDPRVQMEAQLFYERWVRHNLLCDQVMGPPSDGWALTINFQNSYEAAWFGCPFHFVEGGLPDTRELFKESKEKLADLPPPLLLDSPFMRKALEFYEYMQERAPQVDLEGKPAKAPQSLPGEGTDGPFTVACKLRGLTELCLDLYEDERFFHTLMDYVTTNTIRRMRGLREWRWKRHPASPDAGSYRKVGWGFADDAVAMLSCEQYRDCVLPYHRRLVEEFSGGGGVGIHLCGNATHLFPLLHHELGVTRFDTGFPVDFAALREKLGPDVEILGGPTVMLLRNGTPAQVRDEVRRICGSGIMRGGRFILREANNLAPCTPVENVVAFYEAAKEYGTYEAP